MAYLTANSTYSRGTLCLDQTGATSHSRKPGHQFVPGLVPCQPGLAGSNHQRLASMERLTGCDVLTRKVGFFDVDRQTETATHRTRQLPVGWWLGGIVGTLVLSTWGIPTRVRTTVDREAVGVNEVKNLPPRRRR